jgi:RimJ/RimL family protein N-acetyltransferase
MTDAEAISADVSNSLPELKRFMPWSHAEQTPKSHLARLRENEAEYWRGEDMVMGLFGSDGRMRTMVGLHPRVPLNPAGLEIGYWAPTAYAGQGWTTFAVKLMVVYAFDKLGADRVQVSCDEANAASRRVIEKCGFELEGTLRNVTPAATPELVAGGFAGTQRSLLFALVPESFAKLSWVEETRASMTYVNLAGYELRARHVTMES